MRLKKPRSTVGKFIRVAKRLDALLGPILVQLPPHWNTNISRLDRFLSTAPREFRWAVEFRDARWLCNDVFNILQRHKAALCIHDWLEDHPRILTASWTYLRYHGNRYAGSYSAKKLALEARWLRQQLAGGCDVYAYFNNDTQGFAVRNALELKRQMEWLS